MFIETPSFPDTLALGATGGPGFRTSVVAMRGGVEQRNQHWARPLGKWDVGQVNRSEEETRLLFAFFYTIAQGRLNGFRFRDRLPGEAQGINEPLGLGTGGAVAYQLIKRYRFGGYIDDRVITKPTPGSLTVYDNDVPTGSFAVNTTTGIVTMTAVAGHVLTASFLFEVPVRFDTDALPVQRIDPGYWSWGNIQLLETRDYL